MTILHFADSLNSKVGGPAGAVAALAAAQASDGHDVRVVSVDYRGLGEGVDCSPARAWAVAGRRLPLRTGAWAPRLRATLDDAAHGCEVVHVHGLWLPSHHVACKAARGSLLVISPRGTLDRWSRARKSIRKAIAWRLWVARDLRRADLVHATSDEEDLSVRKVLPRCPTCVVPNGVRLPSLDAPHPQATDDVADSLDGRRVLLFLSRLDPKKGLDLLAAAWSAVRGRFPSWTLVIAGESLDGDDASYRRLFAGVDVVFAGHVIGAAREALFRNASLFVLPSRSENFGNSVAEALAFGVPVITTTATPWRDLPSAGCGWCVDPDATALAVALEDALGRDHDHLHRMGGIGRRFVASKFAWPDIAKTMVGHYEVAIERMRRGAD